MRAIDVNADSGDGFDDATLAPLLTSMSIACGGHAGDATSMAATLRLAARHGLRAGAHPSYPDRQGFGRRELEMAPEDLERTLVGQIEAIVAEAGALGIPLTHVKTHGALYNRAWVDAGVAAAVARAVAAVDNRLAVFCPPGSAQQAEALAAGLRPVTEVFLDRGYGARGRLLPRSAPDSLVTDPDRVPDQLRRLLSVEFETMCVHGDNPAAAALLQALPGALREAGCEARPYRLEP